MNESFAASFEDVRKAELAWIAQRRRAANVADTESLVGLALSGGGIRSAAFNLGVLQALNRAGLLSRVDYLSSVSGGGYIGSCLTWLRQHVPVDSPQQLGAIPLASGRGSVLDWIRAHGKYLIAGQGLSGWTLAASILAGTLLNVFVLLPVILLFIGIASSDLSSVAWPAALRMPGAHAVPGHDGFMVLFCLGCAMLVGYVLMTLVFAVSTALPSLRRVAADFYVRRKLGQLLASGLIALAIGALPLLTQIEETAVMYLQENGTRELARHASWLLPLVTGAFSLWRSTSNGTSSALPIVGLSLLLYGGFTGLYHLVHHTDLLVSSGYRYWLLASLVLACVCDINAISMHSYYRAQLAAAFLPEVRTSAVHTDADSQLLGRKPESRAGQEPECCGRRSAGAAGRKDAQERPMMYRLTDIDANTGGPYQIINTTLNTTSSKNATYRARNGESFVLAPLYCGSSATGYRRTSDYANGRLTLSTAMSISGAAVDPDTYATRARAISFLMTLLNVRLGFWADNPRRTPSRWRWPAWYQAMFREMLGIGLSETEARIHLADGGHFENLGVYELLRRRCRYIIMSDAGADPNCTLADLGQAVQRARADLGADIEICADALTSGPADAPRKRVHLLGTVRYADGSSGELLYVKALLRTELTADIYAYWRTNPDFPNQPTENQFFGEMQFDSYRELGQQLMRGVIGDARSIEEVFAPTRTEERGAMRSAG